MTNEENIVLFDGVCNLCNGSVNFIIDRDSGKNFKFLPIQNEKAHKILNDNNLNSDQLFSIFLYQKGHLFEKSTAVLKIARKLNGLWPVLYGLMIIPKFLRDSVYGIIAKNRYKWFGRREHCRIPTPDILDRFI